MSDQPTSQQVDASPSAFQALKTALKADAGYAWAWHCNLAMPIMDSAKVSHRVANEAAAHLMRHMFDIDTSQNECYQIDSDGGAESALAIWATEKWHAEVANRPLVNVHRRTLDDTWRQVLRYAGADPVALLGPAHDDLLAASSQQAGAQPVAPTVPNLPDATQFINAALEAAEDNDLHAVTVILKTARAAEAKRRAASTLACGEH